ncbi:dihydrofolate reductase family protein [Sinosporangium siamense]|uniref:Deaminase n=1 Tax=Sinosporangium siamense TaxID=1367973 RepID=A0A919V9D2_9ACTN|nr:dihydrofolate reductase family protein [Sinosporangium siamense]GII94187.1 deaminase [Sinosporangium siamense]
MRKLVYYIGMTLDGFIAGPDGETDFFPVTQDVLDHITEHYPETLPTHIRGPLGADVPNRTFDTGVMGLATYEPALRAGITNPYAHLRQYLVSTTTPHSPDPDVTLISADVAEAVRRLKAEDGGDIYLIGGARLAGSLLPEIDTLIVKLYPVVAGQGIPLFTTGFTPTHLTLRDTTTLSGGTLVLTYDRKTE